MASPNLAYIRQLARNNKDFENKLIAVLKKELPEETGAYIRNMDGNNLSNAAESVHKIRHKIGMLGMETEYDFAHTYEEMLKVGDGTLHPEFMEIIEKMSKFLALL